MLLGLRLFDGLCYILLHIQDKQSLDHMPFVQLALISVGDKRRVYFVLVFSSVHNELSALGRTYLFCKNHRDKLNSLSKKERQDVFHNTVLGKNYKHFDCMMDNDWHLTHVVSFVFLCKPSAFHKNCIDHIDFCQLLLQHYSVSVPVIIRISTFVSILPMTTHHKSQSHNTTHHTPHTTPHTHVSPTETQPHCHQGHAGRLTYGR